MFRTDAANFLIEETSMLYNFMHALSPLQRHDHITQVTVPLAIDIPIKEYVIQSERQLLKTGILLLKRIDL